MNGLSISKRLILAPSPQISMINNGAVSTGAKRIPQLDGLRAFAFFSVFLYHSTKFGSKLVLWAGVDLFFVLSGFLITGILLRSSDQPSSAYFGRFYWRRAQRILPPYVIGTVLAASFFNIHLAHAWPWYAFFVSNVGQAIGADIRSPMTTFWSLAVEEQFYLLWPTVIMACSERTLARICTIGVLVVPVIRAACSPWLSLSGGIYLLTPFRLDLLLVGSLIAIVWRRNKASIPKSWKRLSLPTLVGSIALFLALCTFPNFEKDRGSVLFDSFGYSLILLFCATLLLIVLSVSPNGWLFRFLCYRPIAYLGRISYMMYLLHSTCVMTSVKYLNAYGHLLSRSVALFVTIGLSALSWHFIEQPLLNCGTRWFAGERQSLLVGLAGSSQSFP